MNDVSQEIKNEAMNYIIFITGVICAILLVAYFTARVGSDQIIELQSKAAGSPLATSVLEKTLSQNMTPTWSQYSEIKDKIDGAIKAEAIAKITHDESEINKIRNSDKNVEKSAGKEESASKDNRILFYLLIAVSMILIVFRWVVN